MRKLMQKHGKKFAKKTPSFKSHRKQSFRPKKQIKHIRQLLHKRITQKAKKPVVHSQGPKDGNEGAEGIPAPSPRSSSSQAGKASCYHRRLSHR